MQTKSYQQQYDMMMRWYGRMTSAYKGLRFLAEGPEFIDEDGMTARMIGDPIGLVLAISGDDIVYAFCQSCYHLKDWMKADPNVTSLVNESDIEDFINNSRPLSLCGDLCNGSKHCQLQRFRVDSSPTLSSEGELDRSSETELDHLGSENVGLLIKHRYEVHYQGKKCDALDLAKSCIDEWKQFIKTHNLPFREAPILNWLNA